MWANVDQCEPSIHQLKYTEFTPWQAKIWQAESRGPEITEDPAPESM